MAAKWTLEQQEAINIRNCNLLVAAAAGSGKTAVLVERIIKMITDPINSVDIDRLLVVTFTSAAASEMRERIGDAISRELEKDPSSQNLQRQLSLLNRSNIMTMHSFCLDVIKNNYHKIDLDPSFRIGDDTECFIIQEDVLNELLEDRYEKGNKSFLDLVEAYGGKKNDDNLRAKVLDVHKFIMSGPWPKQWLNDNAQQFNINSIDDIEHLLWSKELKKSIAIEVESNIYMMEEAVDVCLNNSWLEKYLESFNIELNDLRRLYDIVKKGSLEDLYSAINSVTFGRLKTIKKTEVKDEELQNKVKEIRETVKKSMKTLQEDVFCEDLEKSVESIRSMYPIIKAFCELTIDFLDKYREKKREKNILDFSDLEHLCLEILIEKDENGLIKPSKVALDFKEKFVEVLVDEYQDSNNIQETIINMVSRKYEDNPNVFMVGDIKQSIYKFRQAKPQLFSDKYETYTRENGDRNRKVTLYKNFRSRKEILDGANFIFKSLMSKTVGELEYDEEEQLNLGAPYTDLIEDNILLEGTCKEPYYSDNIEVHILEKDTNENFMEAEESEADINEEEDLSTAELEAVVIGNRIREIMDSRDGKEFMVWDKSLNKYRRVRYKDIVILLRATKGWSDSIVDVLGEMGIPVYADTGTGYFQTIELRTIMSLLHIIDNPRQDIYILAALKSPIFSFDAEDLATLRLVNKDKYFYENIEDICNGVYDVSDSIKEKCLYFYDKLDKWRVKAEYMPMDEFIWFLYSDTSYYGYVGAMSNGVQRQANLRVLFQRAKQYESTSFKGLFNFINFINKLKRSSGDIGTAKILGENEDVVRIMSIHKSKGLEFPVVFLAATGKQFNLMDLKKDLLYHDDLGFGADIVDLEKRISYSSLSKYAIKKKFHLETLSEEMRILYVALTRPREKLIITGSLRDIDKYLKKWCSAASLSKGNKIIESKLIKADSYLDWIGMALARHRDGEIIREEGQRGINLIDDDSKWDFKLWHKNELIKNKVDEEVENSELTIDNISAEIIEEIKSRLEFYYKYKEVCNMPSNISVSDIKNKYMDNEEAISLYDDTFVEAVNLEENVDIEIKLKESKRKKPKFLREKEGLTAAEKGTITHFVMQHIDYSKVTISDTKMLLENMVKDELITKEEAEVVNVYKIMAFFKSALGKRLLKAYNSGIEIYRELPFFREIPVSFINENLDEELFKEDKVRLQGIIDCFFEDENGVVLIDYKTDFVKEGDEQVILDRYKVQIDLYTETLEKILGKEVKERYLYLFGLNKEIKY